MIKSNKDIQWNLPRVGDLMNLLEEIDQARGLMVEGFVARDVNGDWNHSRSDTTKVEEALLAARNEIRLQLYRQIKKRKP